MARDNEYWDRLEHEAREREPDWRNKEGTGLGWHTWDDDFVKRPLTPVDRWTAHGLFVSVRLTGGIYQMASQP